MLVLYLLQLNLLFALLIALVINFLYDSEIKLRVKKLEERYKQEYPELLNIFAILLNSGLSLQKTLEELVSIYSQKQYLGSLVYLDLQRIKNEIKLGLDPRATLDQLILRLPSQELKNSLYLIRRYEEEGSLELLKLISLAASSTWQAYFNARRKSLEENAILLLLPMGMDLLIIMLIAIIPAIASFQGI